MNGIAIKQATQLAASLGVAGDGEELIQTLKATVFKGQVTEGQMAALLIVATQYGLSPWTKEIYAFPDKNNGIVPVVGVDGWSRIINGNPLFDGMDFKQDDESCTCIIYRKDRSHPVSVTEYMSECKRNGVGPWQSHPKRMLRHKAMIQCARLAFGFAGIYDQDEAERITEKDMGVAGRAVDVDAALIEIGAAQTASELADIWKRLAKECEAASDKTAYGQIKAAVTTTGTAIKNAVINVEQENAA